MTIRIELKIGGNTLRTFVAARVSHIDRPQERLNPELDTVFPYKWAEYIGPADDGALAGGSRASGMVHHRYGDGLEALAAKILAAYVEVKGVDNPKKPDAKRALRCNDCKAIIPEGEEHGCLGSVHQDAERVMCENCKLHMSEPRLEKHVCIPTEGPITNCPECGHGRARRHAAACSHYPAMVPNRV